jgi:homoserine O-acetyltransferase
MSDQPLIVTPEVRQVATVDYPLRLRSGIHLDDVRLEVETWGRPNADRSNAILVCHSFCADAHAAGADISARTGHRPWRLGRRGWWDDLIGPGKALDTDRFWVIATGALGSNAGSTGPATVNRHVGLPWGHGFPTVHPVDMVAAQRRLTEQLGIERWRLVVGGSLGGVQALTWALEHGEIVDDVVAIAASARLSPAGRTHFQNWHDRLHAAVHGQGDRTTVLRAALEDAREFSGGPSLSLPKPDFKREWPEKRFSAATYLTLARALLDFDIAADWGGGDLARAVERIRTRVHLLGYRDDGVFSATSQARLAAAIRAAGGSAHASVLPAHGGHDSFLTQPRSLEPWFNELLAEQPTTFAHLKTPAWRASA